MPGALRAMVDDCGALVLIEEENSPGGSTIALSVRLPESHFNEGRAFDLTRESPRDGRARRRKQVLTAVLRPGGGKRTQSRRRLAAGRAFQPRNAR